MVKVVEQLTEIIRIEAKLIDDMFLLLAQHISTEDEEMKEIIDRIGDAAALQAGAELPENDLPF